MRFQRRRGLAVDGVVGPRTRARVRQARPPGVRLPDDEARRPRLGRGGDAVHPRPARLPARRDRRCVRSDDRHRPAELPAGVRPGRRRPGRAQPRSPALRHGSSIEGDPGRRAGAAGRCGCCGRCPGRSATASAPRARAAAPTRGSTSRCHPARRIGAAGVGVTEFAGWNTGGYGNLVVVRHRLGYTTWYAHLSRDHDLRGRERDRGHTLGYVGSTGHATGPHLHFELRKNAVPIDPVPYLLAAVATRASCAGPTAAGATERRRLRRRRRRARVPDPSRSFVTGGTAGRLQGEEPDPRPLTPARLGATGERTSPDRLCAVRGRPRARRYVARTYPTRAPSRAGRAPCRASPRPRPSRAPPRGSCGPSARPPARSPCRGRSRCSGFSAVAIAGVDSAWRRRFSSLASIPSTHFSASRRLADVSSVIESNTLRAIIGTRTFSSKLPCVPATVTAVSFPITWAATWSTTSGITGLTLPGHDRRALLELRQPQLGQPGARARSPSARGPGRSS